MNTIHDEWEDAKYSACSDTAATAADERHVEHVCATFEEDCSLICSHYSRITAK